MDATRFAGNRVGHPAFWRIIFTKARANARTLESVPKLKNADYMPPIGPPPDLVSSSLASFI